MIVVWILRGVLLALFLPLLFPLYAIKEAFAFTGLGVALLVLAAAFVALAVVCALALGLLGRVFDALIVFGLLGLLIRWPRGVRAPFHRQATLAYRSLRRAIAAQLRRCNLVDFAMCLGVSLLAVVMSVSAGSLNLLVSALVVLLVIGLVWKWPKAEGLPPPRKLRLAFRALLDEIRRMLS